MEAEGHHAETNTAIGGDGDTEGLEIKMKSKKMRITRDGVGAVAAAKKQVFDEDGEAMVSETLVYSLTMICCSKCRAHLFRNDSLRMKPASSCKRYDSLSP